MDKPDLAGLIERVEKLTGPDPMIDQAIYEAVRPIADTEAFRALYQIDPDGYWYWMSPFKYTASLDAAVALVERCLPGWGFYLRSDKEGHGCGLVYPDAFRVTPCHCMGATPAIALILALLRAMQEERTPEADR